MVVLYIILEKLLYYYVITVRTGRHSRRTVNNIYKSCVIIIKICIHQNIIHYFVIIILRIVYSTYIIQDVVAEKNRSSTPGKDLEN